MKEIFLEKIGSIWLRKIDLEWIKEKTEKIIVQKDYCL